MNKVFAKETSINDVNGTSFHNHTVLASLNELRELYGEPHFGDGYKVQYDFALKTYEGVVFTIYDWKLPTFSFDKVIDWHIGGFTTRDTRMARNTVDLDLLNLRSFAAYQ